MTASSWAWVIVPLATSGSRADFSQAPLGFDPSAGAGAAGAGSAGGAGAVEPLSAAVVLVLESVEAAGSVTVPVTSDTWALARVLPVSRNPAAPPPSSPAVRPYTARRRDLIGLVLSVGRAVTDEDRARRSDAPPTFLGVPWEGRHGVDRPAGNGWGTAQKRSGNGAETARGAGDGMLWGYGTDAGDLGRDGRGRPGNAGSWRTRGRGVAGATG